MIEQSLVLIKPDAVKKNLLGNIINKLSEQNIKIVAIKPVKVTEDLAKEHYSNLKNKPFFKEVIDYIMGQSYGIDCIFAMVYEGENCIEIIRKVAGSTNPEEASPTSIRGSLGRITTKGDYENVIHASSSQEDAEKEIKLWFKPSELMHTIYETFETNENCSQIKWK